MIHKDKQEKWFQNDTAKGKPMRIIDEPKTLADYERLTKRRNGINTPKAERIVNGDRQADYSDPRGEFQQDSIIASAIMAKENITAKKPL